MSVVLRTVQSFPRGRTTEELHALLGASFRHDERMAVVSELESLCASGSIRRLPNGKWVPAVPPIQTIPKKTTVDTAAWESDTAALVAAPFARAHRTVSLAPSENKSEIGADKLDPHALLKYWRSALRSDPRGATTQVADRHGDNWHMIAGQGPFLPSEGHSTVITIDPEALAPNFRAALLRREANENTLAIGWPIAIGRRSGVPAIWPVGLISAEWRRIGERIEIEVSADDVLINPDWLRGAARMIGWRSNELEGIFSNDDGVGFTGAEFLNRLRDAAAGQIRGKVAGEWLASELRVEREGIFDAAALFLPDDSSFTTGAVRDLDTIAAWPEQRIAGTALAPLLGLRPINLPSPIQPINVSPLNGEQMDAVKKGCQESLTVVTGPPGTGKSQTIVSMVASVLVSGGSVLVASKNHQALDAVQQRLGDIAPEAPFIVRTLDPHQEQDRSFTSTLNELVAGAQGRPRQVDDALVEKLRIMSQSLSTNLDKVSHQAAAECEIADIIERLEARNSYPLLETSIEVEKNAKLGIWSRLLNWLSKLLSKNNVAPVASQRAGRTKADLEKRLVLLRDQVAGLEIDPDIIGLTNSIADLAKRLLPSILHGRTTVSNEKWTDLDNAKADLDFAGNRKSLPRDIAQSITDLRPLWLVSVLGAPKRLPLEEGLFDLVIFDEASQCDIASALPLFARARRAVVVGDSRQLSFIPQLGQAQDRNLMQAQGLPAAQMSRYAQSRNSLFEFAQRMNDATRITLRQQYRSAGPIVDYISHSFYGNALKTAYDPTTIKPPKSQKPGLAWCHVPAPGVPGSNNTNHAEVQAIVQHVERLLMNESYEGTIGVTSPFRGQVHAIEEAVRAKIPMQKLEAAEFRVATVDGFQGQERDVILFSPTLGPASPITAVSFVQRDFRRLNVAISRARAVAHIFGDLNYARSAKVRSLAALASAATEPPKRVGDGVFDSEWERKVYFALKARGLAPEPQYEISGRRLDFALFGKSGVKLDLEVDGRLFHETADGQRKQSDLWRDHQLRSFGWKVRRFWVDELAKNMEACLDIIEQDLA
jgi:very-short-patch-repair endonuclease